MSISTPDDSFVFVNVEQLNLSSNVKEMKLPCPPELKSMHVVSNVRNRYARTVVSSKYVNPDTSAQQATFSIVLPDTAFIAGFVMEIKGKRYEAYVKEEEEAKQEYQEAVSRGRAAAHVAVSARDSNKFTVSVNVEPQSEVIFILTYEELLVRKHGKYEIVINLHPGQLFDDLGVDVHINETRPIIHVETPALRSGHEISDEVTKNKYAIIKKDTEGIVHVSFNPTIQEQMEMAKALSDKDKKTGTSIQLPNQSEITWLSGQFVVEYDVERDPLGGEVLVNDGYFVHFFAPTELKTIPKHVVFVLDVSGSMHGRKIEQLKEAMKVILSELNPEDYFNIIKFANNVQILYSNNSLEETAKTSLPATVENINKAQKVVRSMQANGGTNISDALITALSVTLKGSKVPGQNTNIQPIIIFLTDGQANVGESNSDRIIEIVETRNEDENKSAIFTLAFGNDANKEFLKELAMKNSGFLRNIYEAADAALQLQDFYKQISSPLLTNVNFKYSEEVTEVTKHKFDILFNGSEFVVTGKVDKIVDGFIVVEGSTLYGINDFRPTIIPICPTKEEKDKYGNLERLWAYMTIKQLLNTKYEKKNQFSKHSKDTAGSETPEKQALKLALKYSFVTPVTSLVIVKPEEAIENDFQWGAVQVASSLTFRGNQDFNLYSRRQGMYPNAMNLPQNQCLMGGMNSPPPPPKRSRARGSLCSSPQLFGACSATGPQLQHEKRQGAKVWDTSSQQQRIQSADTALKSIIPQPPELKTINVVSNVRNRYARTVVTRKYVNQEARAQQATFVIVLPDTAFIAGFVMEIKGTKYDAHVREKGQSKKEYQDAVVQGLAAAHITGSTENSNNFIVSINIEPQSEVSFILTYEQLLIKKNNKYEIVTNLHPGHTVEDLEVDVQITDAKPIAIVETPVFRSKNQTMESQYATIHKTLDGSIYVYFKPTVEQQKEIINTLKEPYENKNKGISGQFVVEYKIETDSEDIEVLVNDVPVAVPITDLVVVKSN